jgi:hypothetical protein
VEGEEMTQTMYMHMWINNEIKLKILKMKDAVSFLATWNHISNLVWVSAHWYTWLFKLHFNEVIFGLKLGHILDYIFLTNKPTLLNVVIVLS